MTIQQANDREDLMTIQDTLPDCRLEETLYRFDHAIVVFGEMLCPQFIGGSMPVTVFYYPSGLVEVYIKKSAGQHDTFRVGNQVRQIPAGRSGR